MSISIILSMLFIYYQYQLFKDIRHLMLRINTEIALCTNIPNVLNFTENRN